MRYLVAQIKKIHLSYFILLYLPILRSLTLKNIVLFTEDLKNKDEYFLLRFLLIFLKFFFPIFLFI